MNRKEVSDPNQLDLFKFKPETAEAPENAAKEDQQEPSEEAKQLAREMNPLPGREIKILNRREEQEETRKVKEAFAELGRKLGIEKYIKKNDPQEKLPVDEEQDKS